MGGGGANVCVIATGRETYKFGEKGELIMADNPKISQIKLPNGSTYDIEDANVGISSTYDETDNEVILVVGSLGDADSTEY